MAALPIVRVVLFKHGVGWFERESDVHDDAALALTFKQSEVSDVLKSLTVLDLNGGHVASVSYDSTKPLEQLLDEVALNIPDQGSLVTLLPQIKGARVRLHSGVGDPVEGIILGIDSSERAIGDGVVHVTLLSILLDSGSVQSFDLHQLAGVQILDPVLRRDLDYYLKTQLSAKKKDARTFTFFAQGQGKRTIRVSYTLAAPVWKATYRILLGEEGKSPMIQGWAVVDNTQDEDWENVSLSLIAGLPVSFIHDLYTPRYIRRPEVQVQETTGVLPPTMEDAVAYELLDDDATYGRAPAPAAAAPMAMRKQANGLSAERGGRSAQSSMQAQVRERKIGDLFEYEIEHPVTIRRNQSALVPIVLRNFDGRPVLLYNKQNRAENPMRCVEFKNTTGLTLEGGPVTVLETGNYVGEAMLETIKPDEERLVPYCVELAVRVHDHIDSHDEHVRRIVVRRGTMTSRYSTVMQTTYHFDNKGDAEQIVWLEHPRPSREWALMDTSEPKEITENFWRFRFLLPAKKTVKFVVKQRLLMHASFSLAQLTPHLLDVWIEQKYLDRRTESALRQVFALQQNLGKLEASLNELNGERGQIHGEQKRIRENLQSLGDRPTEKDLRERFVRTLNMQEDRLETIDRETKQRQTEIESLRNQVQDSLGKLEYEAEVGAA
ncbi:MAG: hypothetical protein K2X38_20185 [Gemmataceae bacterium]|nr:hypothetical protein [Gemmataceae bacterium]